MRVARSAPDFIELMGREGTRAPLLLGVFVTTGVALSLIAAPGSAQNVAARLLVATFGGVLVYFGRPRTRRIEIRRGTQEIDVDGTPFHLARGEARLRLASVQREGAPGPTEYGVVLTRNSGTSLSLLTGSEPDRVLRDLVLLQRVIPLRAGAGWGLPEDSPWTLSPGSESDSNQAGAAPSSRPRPNRTPVPTKRGRTKKSIVGTMLVGSAAVSAIVIYDVSQRLVLGETPSALSLILPIIMVSAVVAVALGIGTARTSIELGSDLRFTRFVYGIAIERRSLPRQAIRDAFLVSPEGAAARHLLVHTAEGPQAFACEGDAGEKILDELYGGGPEISSDPPVQSRT